MLTSQPGAEEDHVGQYYEMSHVCNITLWPTIKLFACIETTPSHTKSPRHPLHIPPLSNIHTNHGPSMKTNKTEIVAQSKTQITTSSVLFSGLTYWETERKESVGIELYYCTMPHEYSWKADVWGSRQVWCPKSCRRGVDPRFRTEHNLFVHRCALHGKSQSNDQVTGDAQ